MMVFVIYCLLRILNTFQTDCGDYDPLVWTPSDDNRVDPPENTVAVVVDVRGGQGAIHIIKT